ncbi:hypothetical protein DHB64_17135 [Antarcticibacterium sp. W02-3]|nr:hypothetical protein [Antarcticibacterium sp. W02-3]
MWVVGWFFAELNFLFFDSNDSFNTEFKRRLKWSCTELGLGDSPPAEGCLKGGVGAAGPQIISKLQVT